MNIEIKILEDKRACEDGIKWLKSLGTLNLQAVIEIGIKDKRWSDLRWGISRLMTKAQCVEWAIYCAEQLIDAFESLSPNDDRPGRMIESAKAYLADPSDENQNATYAADAAATYAAYAAAYAADAADAYAADIREKCIWKGYTILSGDDNV